MIENYVSELVSKLELSDKVKVRTIALLNQILKNNVMKEKELKGVIGAALYIVSLYEGERRTLKEIVNVIGISEPTISKRFKEIIEILADENSQIRIIKLE